MRADPAGQDLFDHCRDLVDFHPDSEVTMAILRAIFKIADNYQDGAEDAGSVARACTWIASLSAEALKGL